MAIFVDELRTVKGNEEICERITVTIALEEYRSLIEENVRMMCEINRLNDKCCILENRLSSER